MEKKSVKAGVPSYSVFVMREGESNYLELIDGHGIHFRMSVEFSGQFVRTKGIFGNHQFRSELPVRMIETITYISPSGPCAEGYISSTINVELKYAWATLRVPPYKRELEVHAYGECTQIIQDLRDSEGCQVVEFPQQPVLEEQAA
jgi:hypothetical protein